MFPRSCSGVLYERLGVPPTATASDIHKAYLQLALQLHPDKVGNSRIEEFKAVCEAHDTLKDPARRRLYDTFGRTAMHVAGGSEGGAPSPVLFCLIGFTIFMIASLALTFIVLLTVKVDRPAGWSWFTVFIPVWLTDIAAAVVGVLMLGQFKAAHEQGEGCSMLIIPGAALLYITVTLFVALGLDGFVSPTVAFTPIFLAVIGYGIAVIRTLPLVQYRKLAQAQGHPDPSSITQGSKEYLCFALLSTLNLLLLLGFVLFLYERVAGFTSDSYYLVFSPLMLLILVPAGHSICVVFFWSEQQLPRLLDKLCATALILVEVVGSLATVVMVAAKCQQSSDGVALGDQLKLGVALIPVYLLCCVSLIACCFLCCYGFAFTKQQQQQQSSGDDESMRTNV